MAGIDHQPFIIRAVNQNFQKCFVSAFSAPTDEPLMNAAPLPIVPPGRPGPQYPKHRADKTLFILDNSAPLASLSRYMGFKQRSLFIVYIMPVIGTILLSFEIFLFYHIPSSWYRHHSIALCKRIFMRILRRIVREIRLFLAVFFIGQWPARCPHHGSVFPFLSRAPEDARSNGPGHRSGPAAGIGCLCGLYPGAVDAGSGI